MLFDSSSRAWLNPHHITMNIRWNPNQPSDVKLEQPRWNATRIPVSSEVPKYQKLSTQYPRSNPLETLTAQHSKNFPIFSELAQKYLCLASLSVERLFSMAGAVFQPNRYRMSTQVFQSQSFVQFFLRPETSGKSVVDYSLQENQFASITPLEKNSFFMFTDSQIQVLWSE